jgi:hypothetical protein
MEDSFPALAHRVTVFGSTRNIAATSAGVRSFSPSSALFTAQTSSTPAALRPAEFRNYVPKRSRWDIAFSDYSGN